MLSKLQTLLSLALAGLLAVLPGATVALAQGPNPDGMGHGHGGGSNMIIQVAAQELGMTQRTLISRLRAGQSLADLAEARGIAPQALVETYVGRMQAMLAGAVEAGHMTPEQAHWMLEEAEEQARWCLTHSAVLIQGWGPGLIGFGWGHSGLMDAAAEVLDMTRWELMEALHQGWTLAELAEERGVDPQAIVDTYLAWLQPALDAAVARGALTQEEADHILAEAEEHALWLLDNSMPMLGYGHWGGGCHWLVRLTDPAVNAIIWTNRA